MTAGASLVIGADGTIGRALADHLAGEGDRVLATTRRLKSVATSRIFLDLAADVSQWRPPAPVAVAYLCAAVSTTAQCRRDPAGSAAVNVRNTVALARQLVSGGTFVVFLSTDLVYDGATADRSLADPVCPRTEYGRQKAETERQLSAWGDQVAVLRCSKVIGPESQLYQGWIRALRRREPVHPFSDMVLAPVPLQLVVRALQLIGQRRLTGLFQVSGAADITYEQVARYLAKRIGADEQLVQPIRAGDSGPGIEAIPLHATLDSTRVRSTLGIEIPEVWSVIDTLLDGGAAG